MTILRPRSVLGVVLAAIALPLPAAAQQAERPDESRFAVVELVPFGILDEPMAFEVLRDGTVYIIERKGVIRMYDPVSGTTTRVDSIAVNTKYVNAAGAMREAEEGLVGFTVDPNFEENHWAYFLYAHPTIAKHVLTRMELRGDQLLRDTEIVILEYDVQREVCCHTGGGMTWDRDGNLYITVGNNTANSTGSQTDQRPGRMNWDDQRGSANTNDLRGKILRIRPQPDGTYTIPEGNLFPPGTPNTRPEIYTMGHRNVWRVSVDSKTGYVYWGEVGPDSNADGPNTVRGEDEFNQARGPGFFGWPYFVGNNRAFPITDYVTGDILGPKDPERPINDSRWNTGLRELPPAQPAFISYDGGLSERFPAVATGGRCAVGGPVYRRDDFPNAARPWPEFYEGTWFITECARNWILAVYMDDEGNYVGSERFLPSYSPQRPLDMKFGPEGDLYVVEYGNGWFTMGDNTRLVRIEYHGGNRAPEAAIAASTRGGPVPLELTLSAAGSSDPDGDALTYSWRVESNGSTVRELSGAEATLTLSQPGEYVATLTVTDGSGATATTSERIIAGNEAPVVSIDVSPNASLYFPGEPIRYSVAVTDREDGQVDPARVALSIEYLPEGGSVADLAPVQASGLPLSGEYTVEIPGGDNGRGSVVIRAAYTDQGASGLPAQTSESMVVLRNATAIAPRAADLVADVMTQGGSAVMPFPGGYVTLRNVDLTGIRRVEFVAQAQAANRYAGGVIEVRLGSPDGRLIGEATVNAAQPGGGGGGGGGGQGAAGVGADLEDVAGVHDVYFVVREGETPSSLPLMTLSLIRFSR
ncbi:MAG TPA: PQQ-dependent sugar dehydrogenase [Longimicrobiales bacterium]|nr:PQQ-dependent sugar dehydrogenase [Longimicrobiales bacterium]